MDFVSTEDALLAVLWAESATSADRGCPLSTAVKTVTGDAGPLSQQVGVGVAVESLSGRGLLRQETTDAGRVLLVLTEAGEGRARETYDRMGTTEIELADDTGRQRLSIEAAASELGRSVPAIAASCSEDGVLYRHEKPSSDGVVGRDDERDAARAVLDRCRTEQRGEILFLVGRSGVGKSTLAEAMLEVVGESVDVARSHCQGATNEPYQPVRDLLADADATTDPFARIGPVSAGVATDTAEQAEVYQAQQTALFHDVTELLAPGGDDDVSLRVLFLDDVHCADGATRAYLAYLFDRLSELRLLVLATHLPGEFTDPPPVEGDLVPDTSPVTTLELAELDRDETGQLIEQVVDRRGVPDAFVDAVYERTGGTPLFVEATVHALLESDQLDPQFRWFPDGPDAIELPDEVHETLSQRVDLLDDTGRDVLEWTAVAGDPVPVSVLQEVCDQPANQVATAVDVLVEADVLDRHDADRTVSVRSVTREAVLENVHTAERRRRHGALARQLERAAEDSGEASDAAERAAAIAYHYEQADDAERAIEWYRRAAERATDVYAHETAIEHYHRIIDVARTVEDTDSVLSASEHLAEIYTTSGDYDQASRYVQFLRERVEADATRRRQRVARLAARVATDRGEYDTAHEEATVGLALDEAASRERCRLLGVAATSQIERSMYEEARKTARRQRELATTLEARDLEAAAIRRLGAIARHRGDHERARELLEESLAIADDLDDRESVATIRKELGTVDFEQAEYDRAREYYEGGLEVARELDVRKLESDCLNNLGIVAYNRSEYDRAREYYEASLEITRDIGDRHIEAYNRHNLGIIANLQGEYDRCREHYERSLEIFRDIGDRHAEATTLNNLGSVARNQGEFDQAREYNELGLDLSRDIGSPRGEGANLTGLGIVAQQRGEYARAREYYEESLDIARDIGARQDEAGQLVNLGIVVRRQGEFERAREYFEESLDIARDIGNSNGEGESLIRLGELAQLQGEFELAHEHFDEGLEIASELGTPDIEIGGLCGRGAAARQQEEYEQARESLEAALDGREDAGEPLVLARVHLERSHLALSRGDVGHARDRVDQAREIFRGLDATHWLGRSRALQGRIAAASESPDSAREHWRTALETFEAIGASHDALETLELLVETCREQGDDEQALAWWRRASDALADAPASVIVEHEAWVDRHGSDLDGA